MKFPDLLRGRFVCRDNRFQATVKVQPDGWGPKDDWGEHWAHVPNSGRLTELFTPDRPVWIAPAANPNRKTAYDLKLVEYNSVLVSVDARLPNPLFAEALAADFLPDFVYPTVKREVTYGHSRLDFRLSGPDGVCWVETKSVTLVEDDMALFPDAPTERGRKHLQSLIDICQSGERAAVVFVVQRPDASRFAPHREADPAFAAALQDAARAGVEVRAYICQVSLQEIMLGEEIPVDLDA
jgi:sugar fermentation stimulation protein A